jgi:hypothetical protein
VSGYLGSLIQHSSLEAGPAAAQRLAREPVAPEKDSAPLEALDVEETAPAEPEETGPAPADHVVEQAARPAEPAPSQPHSSLAPQVAELRWPPAAGLAPLASDTAPAPGRPEHADAPPAVATQPPVAGLALPASDTAPAPNRPEHADARPAATAPPPEPAHELPDRAAWQALFNEVVAWVEANRPLDEKGERPGLDEAAAEPPALPVRDFLELEVPLPVPPAYLPPETRPGLPDRPGDNGADVPRARAERPAPPQQDLHLSIGTIYVSVEEPAGPAAVARPAAPRPAPVAGRSRLSRHYLRSR